MPNIKIYIANYIQRLIQIDAYINIMRKQVKKFRQIYPDLTDIDLEEHYEALSLLDNELETYTSNTIII